MKKLDLEWELDNTKIDNLIFKYSIPAVMSGLVASFYNIIDQIFIGNIIGTEGNAATNIAFPLVTLTTALMLLFGLGGTISFSISLGKHDLEEAKKYVGVVLMATPIAGIIISIITFLFSKQLLLFFGATENNYDLAHTYVNITAFGFPLWMTTEAAAKIIRSDGSPKYAMVCSMTGAVLNCVLNPLLMIGFDMGISGAAWATVIGQVISFILVVKYFFNFKMFDIKIKEIMPDLHSIKRTVILGMSSFLNQTVMMLAQIVMNNVFAYYGNLSIYGAEIPLACVGIITKVTSIYMAVMIGIAQGAQPLLGYSYGAGKPDKVIEIYFKCVKYASFVSVIVFLIFQIFPGQILSLFGAKGDLYFEFGIKYFKIFMLMTFLNGIQPVTFNFFSAIGKPIKSTIVSLSKQLLFLIPLVIVIPMFFGIEGMLYAGPIADSLAFLITLIFLKNEIKNLKSKSLQMKQTINM